MAARSRVGRSIGVACAAAGLVLVLAAGTVVADVSHEGWPVIDGVHGGTGAPTSRNDEMLGRDGSDTIHGGAGDDVIWGDANPGGQPTSQHDVLWGDAGNDWLYTSHGTNEVYGGSGNDFIWAYYGHGSIDCGSGDDTVRVRMNGAYTLSGCEHVRHFCTWGENAQGGCHKPGEKGAKREGALG